MRGSYVLYLEANDKMTKQMHRLNHFIQAMRVFPDYKLWMLITKNVLILLSTNI